MLKRKYSRLMSRAAALAILWPVIVPVSGAVAQVSGNAVKPPDALSAIDSNGVDLASRKISLPGLTVAIGGEGSGLNRAPRPINEWGDAEIDPDNFSSELKWVPQYLGENQVGQPSVAHFFKAVAAGQAFSFYVGLEQNGATNFFGKGPFYEYSPDIGAKLLCDNNTAVSMSGNCTVTTTDGTRFNFTMEKAKRLFSIVRPDGEVLSFTYHTTLVNNVATPKAIKSISSSLGWQLKYEVDANWKVTKITGFNTAVRYCDPEALTCTTDAKTPYVATATSGNIKTLSRNGATETTVETTATGFKFISPSGVTRTITCSTSNTCYPIQNDNNSTPTVASVNIGGSIWTYTFATVNGRKIATVAVGGQTLREIPSADWGLWRIRTG